MRTIMEDSETVIDRVESQAALVAESILKYIDIPERDSSKTLQHSLKEIEMTLNGLRKLISANDITSERAIAESLSRMEDFLRLMLRLMQEMMTGMITIVMQGPVVG